MLNVAEKLIDVLPAGITTDAGMEEYCPLWMGERVTDSSTVVALVKDIWTVTVCPALLSAGIVQVTGRYPGSRRSDEES